MGFRTRKRLNDITFDPRMQPGVSTRFVSMENLNGERLPSSRGGSFNKMIARDVEDPDVKFKNMQNPFVKPSTILRKKGYNPY